MTGTMGCRVTGRANNIIGGVKTEHPPITNHRCDLKHRGRFFVSYNIWRLGSIFTFGHQPDFLSLGSKICPILQISEIRSAKTPWRTVLCFSFSSLWTDSATVTQLAAAIFIHPVRITKDDLIKVKSRRQQQEGGCNVYWAFLCRTGSSPSQADVCSASGCIISFLTSEKPPGPRPDPLHV